MHDKKILIVLAVLAAGWYFLLDNKSTVESHLKSKGLRQIVGPSGVLHTVDAQGKTIPNGGVRGESILIVEQTPAPPAK